MASPKDIPSLTDRQIKTFAILNRNRMAWIMFVSILVFFGLVLGAFFYTVFWRDKTESWIKVTFGSIDALLIITIRPIVAYLFPKSKQ
jgi:hypothetical protein